MEEIRKSFKYQDYKIFEMKDFNFNILVKHLTFKKLERDAEFIRFTKEKYAYFEVNRKLVDSHF